VKDVFKNIPNGKMSVGKPLKRQLDDDENDLKEKRVRVYSKTARGTDARKFILKEAMVLHGPYS